MLLPLDKLNNFSLDHSVELKTFVAKSLLSHSSLIFWGGLRHSGGFGAAWLVANARAAYLAFRLSTYARAR